MKLQIMEAEQEGFYEILRQEAYYEYRSARTEVYASFDGVTIVKVEPPDKWQSRLIGWFMFHAKASFGLIDQTRAPRYWVK